MLVPMLENLDRVQRATVKTAKKKRGEGPSVSGTRDTPETFGEAMSEYYFRGIGR
jgi:hypothetical protein